MKQNEPFVIGTRQSKLALWQANYIKKLLEENYPELSVILRFVTTTGDRIQDRPLSKIGGKGLFTRELELEMQDGTIDAAVHSLKDLPYELPEGFMIAAIPARGELGDVLVSRDGLLLEQLPRGARIGTSSLRRTAQLLALRPDVTVLPLRGNVDTRLRKLDEGQYDAIILAETGLVRLGRQDRITQRLSTKIFIPAAGQGALAVEICRSNVKALQLLAPLQDEETTLEVTAERSFSAAIGGSCQIPAGCLAQIRKGILQVTAVVASLDGSRLIRKQIQGDVQDSAALGRKLAADILQDGGAEILKQIKEGL